MPLAPSDLLDKVEAAIDRRLDGGAVDSYAIRGRNLKYVGLNDLFRLRDQLRREVESAGQTGGLPVIYGVKDKRLSN